jgi:serine/threonine-protein kinase
MDVSLQAGRVVGDYWRLQRRLGGGVASRFWEAEDLRGGANVAIEFAFVDVDGPDARLRFSRETRALMTLRHPNVVRTIHRGLAEDSLAFAVTELLRGEDLVVRLAREPALGLPETAQILDAACRVVSRLDVLNIAQQLLEPKQVFFAIEQMNARIVKLLNIGFEASVRIGSPYVSPERVGVRTSVTPSHGAAQVWAIGVLGYRMLAGELPFAPGTRELDPEWTSRLARLGEQPGELPPELDDWFRTAIHPDPTQRFGSAEQAGLAFGHIASTYASSLARARRERPAVREAGAVSVVTGAGAIVRGRTPVDAVESARGVSIGRSDESGVRLALAQPAVPSSSIPPPLPRREKRDLQFKLGRIPDPPSLATREPEPLELPAPVDEPTLLINRSKATAASERASTERSRRYAVAVLAVAIGVLAGYTLRSALMVLERSHTVAAPGAAALRSIAPSQAIVPIAPPPAAAPVESVAAPVTPASRPFTENPQPATDADAPRTTTDVRSRPARPTKRAPRERVSPAELAEPVDPANRPLISSRPAPANGQNAQLAVSRSTPRAIPSDVVLPAAPPPLDTTPVQVYRGF